MFEKSFIPDGLDDLITVFTAIVALVTILQVLQLKRLLAPVADSEARRMFFRALPWTLTFTFFGCVLTVLLIWVLHALLTMLATENIKEVTTFFGCVISLWAGLFLGMLANFGVEYRLSPPISTHLAFVISILLCACFLGSMAWSWSGKSIGLIAIVEEMWPAAAVAVAGIGGYLITGKPWESFKS